MQGIPAEALQAFEQKLHEILDMVTPLAQAHENQMKINDTLASTNAELKKEIAELKQNTAIIMRELEKAEPIQQLSQLMIALHAEAPPPQPAPKAPSPGPGNAQSVQPQPQADPVGAPTLPGPGAQVSHQPVGML